MMIKIQFIYWLIMGIFENRYYNQNIIYNIIRMQTCLFSCLLVSLILCDVLRSPTPDQSDKKLILQSQAVQNLQTMMVCQKGTYRYGNKCLSCIKGCSICRDQNTCQICNSLEHYILEDNICVCNYLENVEDIGEKCVCKSKFYNDSDICKKCQLGCLSCFSNSSCQTCNKDMSIIDGVCQCINNTTFIDHEGFCQQCQLYNPFCLFCANDQQCTMCHPDTNRQLKDGRCVCRKGFIPDHDQICRPCDIPGCLQCEDLQQLCRFCDSQQFWEKDLNGKCQCMRNYSRFEQTCIRCGQGCITCNPDKCVQCDTKNHFVNNNGICHCASGFYLDNSTCKSCSVISYCLECKNNQQCIKCMNTFVFNQTSHKCECSKGKFVENDKCIDCPKQCVTCISAKNCTSCKKGYVLKDGQCKKSNAVQQMIEIIIAVMLLATIIFRLLK